MGEYSSMSPSTPLPVHKERPKIKIIHIIAPEIIKTDVANFRDLVQRLTGKPEAAATAAAADTPPPLFADDEAEEEEQKKKVTTIKKKKRPAAEMAVPEMSEFMEKSKKTKIKCEVKVEEGGFGAYGLDHGELWSTDLTPGGFLSFLEEDVFQEMAADFLLPLGSSRMDFVGEMYAS